MHFRAERSPTRWTLGVESERFGLAASTRKDFERRPHETTRYAVTDWLRADYVCLRVRHG
jgi:hypothetical protein